PENRDCRACRPGHRDKQSGSLDRDRSTNRPAPPRCLCLRHSPMRFHLSALPCNSHATRPDTIPIHYHAYHTIRIRSPLPRFLPALFSDDKFLSALSHMDISHCNSLFPALSSLQTQTASLSLPGMHTPILLRSAIDRFFLSYAITYRKTQQHLAKIPAPQAD